MAIMTDQSTTFRSLTMLSLSSNSLKTRN